MIKITEHLLKEFGFNEAEALALLASITDHPYLEDLITVLKKDIQKCSKSLHMAKEAEKPKAKSDLELAQIKLSMLLMHSIPVTQEILDNHGVDPSMANKAALRYALFSYNIAMTRLFLQHGFTKQLTQIADDEPGYGYDEVLAEAQKLSGPRRIVIM